MLMVEIFIVNGNKMYSPIVEDDIQWETQRKGSPGKLTFTVVKDNIISFQEGNAVIMKVDGENIFYGFVFSKSRDKQHNIKVTCYDQLRYLKNKITIQYKNKTASDVVKMLANDYKFNLGIVESTSYVIPERTEENKTLFDIILNALDLEVMNKKQMFVLYDDFGKLTLKSLNSMKTTLLVNEETGENFDYTSSIDDNTYNKVVLLYKDDESGTQKTFIAKDDQHMNDWGILQYFETIDNEIGGQARAEALLDLYNAKTRKLKIKNAFGNIKIRAGSMVVVVLNLGDIEVGNYFLVETCKHSFKNDEHLMDLTLRGGEFIE